MKTKILSPLCVFAVCAVSSPAFAQGELTPYFSLRAGVASGSAEVDIVGYKETFKDSAFTGSLAVGARISPISRVEFEYTHIGSAQDTKYGYVIIPSFDPAKLTGDFKSNTFMANVYFDMPYWSDKVVPYIGAGMGFSAVQGKLTLTNLLTNTSVSDSEDKVSFTFGGALGLSIPLNHNLAFDAGFRYLRIFYEDGFNIVSGTIGLRYQF